MLVIGRLRALIPLVHTETVTGHTFHVCHSLALSPGHTFLFVYDLFWKLFSYLLQTDVGIM